MIAAIVAPMPTPRAFAPPVIVMVVTFRGFERVGDRALERSAQPRRARVRTAELAAWSDRPDLVACTQIRVGVTEMDTVHPRGRDHRGRGVLGRRRGHRDGRDGRQTGGDEQKYETERAHSRKVLGAGGRQTPRSLSCIFGAPNLFASCRSVGELDQVDDSEDQGAPCQQREDNGAGQHKAPLIAGGAGG